MADPDNIGARKFLAMVTLFTDALQASQRTENPEIASEPASRRPLDQRSVRKTLTDATSTQRDGVTDTSTPNLVQGPARPPADDWSGVDVPV